jgi:hypothetical protein
VNATLYRFRSPAPPVLVQTTKAAAMSTTEFTPSTLQFPQPPSTKDTKSDPAATLAWLKTNLATIYTAGRTTPAQGELPTLARGAYLDMYSTVHNYCMVTKAAPRSQQKDFLTPGHLYRGLRDAIATHCSEIRVLLVDSESSTGVDVDGARRMIGNYLAQQEVFTQLADLISHLLRSLDKEWITREISEKKKDMHLIKDLHTVVWKNEILQVGVDSSEEACGSKIAAAMATLQKQGEDGAEGDDDLVGRFLESLKAMGVGPGKV